MSAANATVDTVVRPAGLGYSPPSVERYDSRSDIPANALDAQDFPTIDSWLDACIAQDRPGKIGSGTYEVDGLARYAPKGIYGYGDTPPKFVAQDVDCWLYLKDQSVTLKGLQFEGFGQVLGGAVELSKGSPYHSETKYGFDRFLTPEQGGTALELRMDASVKTVGPDVDISDCTFVNCENAFTFVSDTTQMGRVDFNNNALSGTFGMLDVDSVYWTEVYASGNEWADCVGDRAQPNVKQNGVQTGFKIGVDRSPPLEGHSTVLSIVNNYAHDIQSVGTFQDTNAAVFVDVRGAESADRGDNVISFNQIERVQGLRGQEDSNAIYAKAWGLVIQGNVIEESGAAYINPDKNGSEATGILIKPLYDGVARDIEIIGNTFIDMPGIPKGVWPDLAVVKVSEAVGNSSVSFNNFIGGGNLSGSSANGIVRWYGDFEKMKIVGNSFQDVKLGDGDNVIVLYQLDTKGDPRLEVSNNSASTVDGPFDSDVRMITINGGKSSPLVTGHNTVEGGWDMLLSRPGTGTAPLQAYVPPTVPVEHGTGPSLSVELTAALVENGTRQVRVADLSYTDGATITVDDPRFLIKDHGLYLKAGQSIDYETGKVITLSLTAGKDGRAAEVPVTFSVIDANDAPTAISVGNLRTLNGSSVSRALVGDVVVTDPDQNSAYRVNTVQVSDSRFEVVDGHLYLRAGQSLRGDVGGLELTLTATGAGKSVKTTVDVSVDFGEGPSPSSEYSNVVTGSAQKDTLLGSRQADLIDGGAREDIMIGGKGNDTYIVSGYKDEIVENANGGVDTAILQDNRYFLPDWVENLTATAGNSLLVGNELSNILKGSAGDDTFIGHGGADRIELGGGADRIIVAPSDGNDVVVGFSGDDHLSIAAAQFTSLDEVLAAFSQIGNDAVLKLDKASSVTLKDVKVGDLTASQFDLGGTGAVAARLSETPNPLRGGTAVSDLVLGTAEADYIDGKSGADVMIGGDGNDIYVVDNVGDRVIEAKGEGLDLVLLRTSTYAMDAYVENVTVKGGDGTDAGTLVRGNQLSNWIEGGIGADTLLGGGGNDVIVGGAGDDIIDGGSGVDTLFGGMGKDVYRYASPDDFGDVIADFDVGHDLLDLSALMDEIAGVVSVGAVAGGTGVFFSHGGQSDLVVTLKDVDHVRIGELVA